MNGQAQTGGPVEIDDDIEIVAELVDDEVETDDVVVGEVETDEVESGEVEADDPDVIDAIAQHEGGEADAAALDAEISESVEQREVARYRHPAAAAALAKRVAMDRSARIAVASLVLVAFLFLFVFPTRSYLAQQRQVRDARHSVQVLREQNEKLSGEAKRLQTDKEIEKLARSQFNMVFDGEEAYNVVPPDGSPTTTTEP
jgi:cell division protein FtsB